MTRNAHAAAALFVGSIAVLTTMGLHPSGADIVHEADTGGANALVSAVHALALVAMPLLLAGTAWLSWCLRARPVLALTAFMAYLLAVCAVSVAAVASGFIAPAAAARAADAGPGARDLTMLLFHYTGSINQAFAKVFVGLSSVAMMLWSVAMSGHGAFPRALSWLGHITAAALVLGVGSGHLQLGVHGFGGVVVAQTVWTLWMANCLRRMEGEG